MRNGVNPFIPHPECDVGQHWHVPSRLDEKLAQFLRQRRGVTTYTAFARKLGISASTLHRLENCQQSATLERVSQIMIRLKCDASDIFSSGK